MPHIIWIETAPTMNEKKINMTEANKINITVVKVIHSNMHQGNKQYRLAAPNQILKRNKQIRIGFASEPGSLIRIQPGTSVTLPNSIWNKRQCEHNIRSAENKLIINHSIN
jgi:hypothetical protein